MPPKSKVTKELIIDKSFEIVENEGIFALNARSLAKKLNCSTMPIYSLYKDMNDLKLELKKYIDNFYSKFISNYLDLDNYLFTMSYAYIAFALNHRELFNALFIEEFVQTRTIREVIDSPWNREAIEQSAKQFNISIEESEKLYRDIRFYSHGIATQIYGGNILIMDDEIKELVDHAIEQFLK